MDVSPQNYPIADFIKWNKDRELILNPEFQRNQVWQPSAKTYLIDTILKGMPIPKILFRTKVDRASQGIIREVVDGQQRLTAILEFASGKLQLSNRSEEFSGMRYGDLTNDLQDRFLSYKITSEQLVNATDDDVLEVFLRINSYAVTMNGAEKRHAKYDDEFKWSLMRAMRELSFIWDRGVVGDRDRVRMKNLDVTAEMFGYFIYGVGDGGDKVLDRTFSDQAKRCREAAKNNETEDLLRSYSRIEKEVASIARETHDLLSDIDATKRLWNSPHFLVFFAAIGLSRQSLSLSDAYKNAVSIPSSLSYGDDYSKERLSELNSALVGEVNAAELHDESISQYVNYSKSNLIRKTSRAARLNAIFDIIGG